MSPRALYRKIKYGFSSSLHMLAQWTSQLARMSDKCEIPSSNPRWGKVFFFSFFLFSPPQPQDHDQPPYTLSDIFPFSLLFDRDSIVVLETIAAFKTLSKYLRILFKTTGQQLL